MDVRLLGRTVTVLCCPPRATAIATEVSTTWGPAATIGRLRPKTPTTRGASTSIPAEWACSTTVVAAVDPSGLSKINDCARKSAIARHSIIFIACSGDSQTGNDLKPRSGSIFF